MDRAVPGLRRRFRGPRSSGPQLAQTAHQSGYWVTSKCTEPLTLKIAICQRLLADHEPADRQTTRRAILWRERHERDLTHVDWRALVRVRRLKERVRADLVERNPDPLPDAARQLAPRRVDNMVPISERHRQSHRMIGLDLK